MPRQNKYNLSENDKSSVNAVLADFTLCIDRVLEKLNTEHNRLANMDRDDGKPVTLEYLRRNAKSNELDYNAFMKYADANKKNPRKLIAELTGKQYDPNEYQKFDEATKTTKVAINGLNKKLKELKTEAEALQAKIEKNELLESELKAFNTNVMLFDADSIRRKNLTPVLAREISESLSNLENSSNKVSNLPKNLLKEPEWKKFAKNVSGFIKGFAKKAEPVLKEKVKPLMSAFNSVKENEKVKKGLNKVDKAIEKVSRKISKN